MNVLSESMTIAAGHFGAWLEQARASLRGAAGTNVPCGDCVGCCVSSYYIPLRAEDTHARALIPDDMLVEAAGPPPGRLMIGYHADGTCPMLAAGKCRIYAQRPQTCRDYDCRIFAAAGIDAGGPDKIVINTRVRAWRFTYETESERRAHAAITAAATFIREQRAHFPGGRAPTTPTGIAVLAIKAHGVFLDESIDARSPEQTALAIIAASRAFDAA